MSAQLTHEDLIFLNSILRYIPFYENFNLPKIHYESLSEKQPHATTVVFDSIKNQPEIIERYKRIEQYLLQNNFVKYVGIEDKSQILLLTYFGKVLCSYGSLQLFIDKDKHKSTKEEIINRVTNIIEYAYPYGEFVVEVEIPEPPRVINANPFTAEGDSNIQALADYLNPHKRYIAEFEGRKQNEEVLQYLISEGFAINRHDINDKTTLYRQLTDKGRKLKELGSIKKYNLHVAQENAEADRRKKRDENFYSINFWIAVGTSVVAIYTVFQMFDFYNQHTLNWVYFFYFATGVGLGLLIQPLKSVLKKMLNR